jgi:hypothetical protein
MSQVTVNQVRQVRKYSALARGACTALLAFLAASFLLVARLVIAGPHADNARFTVGDHVFSVSDIDSVGVKAGLLVMGAIGAGMAGIIIYLLRRIFANMARGEIFNAGNVRHIRAIGVVILVIGFLNVVLPVVSAALSARGYLGPAVPPQFTVRFPGLLAPFAMAGLIYLASWIMLVGLGVSEEAEELRRDADLVV